MPQPMAIIVLCMEQDILVLTLQWEFKFLLSSAGQKGFKFIVQLNAFTNIWCTDDGNMKS
jgi:hypothetical protein